LCQQAKLKLLHKAGGNLKQNLWVKLAARLGESGRKKLFTTGQDSLQIIACSIFLNPTQIQESVS
jgi:hypothetical protein